MHQPDFEFFDYQGETIHQYDFLVGSCRRENFAIWDGRRRRSWSEHVTHCLPMKNSVVG
jgi:hypothetical protein